MKIEKKCTHDNDELLLQIIIIINILDHNIKHNISRIAIITLETDNKILFYNFTKTTRDTIKSPTV